MPIRLTVNLGTLNSLRSLVMVPTTTAIFPSRPSFFMWRTRPASDSGGRWILDMKRRLRTMLLNLASVRRARNR
jgi:hypothetical protein